MIGTSTMLPDSLSHTIMFRTEKIQHERQLGNSAPKVLASNRDFRLHFYILCEKMFEMTVNCQQNCYIS